MRRALAWLGLAGAAACSGGPPPAALPWPDWTGPAVHARHLGDRGLELELVAPTAGHRFELVEVAAGSRTATVRCLWRTPPADALVAQVVTPQRLVVPADRLGKAEAVAVWIHGPEAAGGTGRLALTTARP